MGELRIVSLLPSATEIVCCLGLQDYLVGRSHECDFPARVETLPVCTEPKLPVHGTSREIHEGIGSLLQNSLSVYAVKTDVLAELAPTHIITQDQCEVCAVSLADVQEAACNLTGGAEIVSLAPEDLEGIFACITRVGQALQREDAARDWLQQARERIETVRDRASRQAEQPRTACIEWIDPLMAAGNWVPELVGLAGGDNLFGEAGKHSSWMKWQAICDADPDVLVMMPCGFDLPKTRIETAVLQRLPEWGELKAVKRNQVYFTDGNQYFNRPGPRMVDSLEILAEILHPQAFPARHLDQGWTKTT